MEKQNKLYHKHRKALSELTKNDLEELLEVNSQEIPAGKDEVSILKPIGQGNDLVHVPFKHTSSN